MRRPPGARRDTAPRVPTHEPSRCRAAAFERRELIARHGWPDVDVHELELDEL